MYRVGIRRGVPQGGLDPKRLLAERHRGCRELATDGSRAGVLIEGMDAGALPADQADDTNAIEAPCKEQGIKPVIPSKTSPPGAGCVS